MRDHKQNSVSIIGGTVGQVLTGPIDQTGATIRVGEGVHLSFLTSPIEGSGIEAEQARDLVGPIHGITVAGVATVEIVYGRNVSCQIVGDDNLLDSVVTDVADGRLTVRSTGSISCKLPLKVVVTAPAVEDLRVSGAGNIAHTSVNLDTLRCTVSGAGNIRMKGRAEKLTIRASGAGSVDGGELHVGSVDISASGASTIVAHASLFATIEAIGVSEVTVHGNPAQRTTRCNVPARVTWK